MNQDNASKPFSIRIDQHKLSRLAAFALTLGSAILAMAIWKLCLPHQEFKSSCALLCFGLFFALSWCLIDSKERAAFVNFFIAGTPEIYIEDKAHYLESMSRFTDEVLNQERSQLVLRNESIQKELIEVKHGSSQPFFIQGLGFIAFGALLMFGAMALVMGAAIIDLSSQSIAASASAKDALESLENGRVGLDLMQIGLYLSGMLASILGIATGLAGFWRNRKVGSDPLDAPVDGIQDRIDLIDDILKKRRIKP